MTDTPSPDELELAPAVDDRPTTFTEGPEDHAHDVRCVYVVTVDATTVEDADKLLRARLSFSLNPEWPHAISWHRTEPAE